MQTNNKHAGSPKICPKHNHYFKRPISDALPCPGTAYRELLCQAGSLLLQLGSMRRLQLSNVGFMPLLHILHAGMRLAATLLCSLQSLCMLMPGPCCLK